MKTDGCQYRSIYRYHKDFESQNIGLYRQIGDSQRRQPTRVCLDEFILGIYDAKLTIFQALKLEIEDNSQGDTGRTQSSDYLFRFAITCSASNVVSVAVLCNIPVNIHNYNVKSYLEIKITASVILKCNSFVVFTNLNTSLSAVCEA